VEYWEQKTGAIFQSQSVT